MMPRVKDICRTIARWAPEELAEPWDNVGLQVGDPSARVSKILVALDPSHHAIRKALSIGARMIVTHHPLLFKPVSSMDLSLYTPGLVAKLIKADIALASAHTNLDSAAGGVSDVLAEGLGIIDPQPLVPNAARPKEGLGRVGLLPKSQTLEEIAEKVADFTGSPALLITGDLNTRVHKTAICAGSGSDLWPRVLETGAQLYITAEIKHHVAREAERQGVCLIDAGHYYTEHPVTAHIASFLRETAKKKAWNLDVQLFQEEVAPLDYWEKQ